MLGINLREQLFKIWYWYVNKIDKKAEVLFMNYGFHESGKNIPLSIENEPNRYSIQLYHHLATETEIKGKDILEIGCGRGGGLSYIAENFSPASAKGIDLDALAVAFCQKHYTTPCLTFEQGDAQKLHLPDQAFDVIFNVESSHRYPDMPAFLQEVNRLLRPKAYFLFTDFRYPEEMEVLKKQLADSGMQILRERNINKEVVEALNLDDGRRRDLVKKLTPKLLHSIALNFAGARGSETYAQFDSGKYVYFSYVIQKN